MENQTQIKYLEQSMAEFKKQNDDQHKEIKESVANLNTVINASWQDVTKKVEDGFLNISDKLGNKADREELECRISDLRKESAPRWSVVLLWSIMAVMASGFIGLGYFLYQETLKNLK